MIGALARLLRLKLSLLNGVAAAGGCLLFPAPLEPRCIAAALVGVTLLAAGGSALNQVLERDLDSRMARTRQRPLPAGQMTPAQASAIAIALLLAGLVLLLGAGGRLPPILGTFALFWYLVVYTPLKHRTSLALPVGALCGAFPPLIGWCLSGGAPGDYRIIFLAGLLFLWQVPHFWLYQQRHQDDYRQAGIPLFCCQNRGAGQGPFFWVWMAAFAAGTMLLPAFGIVERPLAHWYAAFSLALFPICLLGTDRLLFRYINLFPLLVSILLLIQNFS